jgi:hypothetical protein
MTISIIKSNDVKNDLLNDIVKLVDNEGVYSDKRLHTFDYYSWKLKNNPCGAYVVVNYSGEDLMCLITFTAKGEAVNDSSILYELGDVYVSSKMRGGGCFFRMLRRFHQEFPEIKVYGTPNDLALPTELKVGYKQLDIGLKYSFMPFGIPLFHFLGNRVSFFKYLYKIDLFTRMLNRFIYLFVKDIECEVLVAINNIDLKLFSSSLFVKSERYLLWRYSKSPEPYKYIISMCGENIVIYKNILYKNIPFVIIVDHNLKSSLRKRQMLKQILIKERVFGVFEMTASSISSILSKFNTLTVKVVKFITYGDFFNKNQSMDDVRFLAGDTDNV